jgi:hypothetical protein
MVLMMHDHSQGSAGKPAQYQSKVAALSDEVWRPAVLANAGRRIGGRVINFARYRVR